MRRIIALVCFVAVWISAWMVAPAVGASSPSTPTGKIAFASDRLAIKLGYSGPVCYSASCSDIYVVNADGSGLTRLTPTSLTGFENCPSWSPDGTRIVFERTYKGYEGYPSHQLYLMNADGSAIAQLTFGNQQSVCPAWSPDGTAIAFTRRPRDGAPPPPYGHIAVMNPDGTGVVEITSGTDYDNRPQWSPDGSKIVFERDSFCCEPVVYTVNRDGSGLTKLVEGGGGAAWSPDGKKISFWNYRTDALQTLDLRSGTTTTLATGAQVGGDPADCGVFTGWSPDGRWVTVAAQGDVSCGAPLVLVSSDGKSITQVPNGEDAMGPAWHA